MNESQEDPGPAAGPEAEPEPDLTGPNLFADNRRRRIPGIMYCILGLVALVVALARAGDAPVLVDGAVAVAAAMLIIFGAYSIVTGIGLDVDEEAALRLAALAVQEPMGHAAAQMGWRGWRSRPTWRILWYSAEDPPLHRGLVFVDGHDGEILDVVTESNPEVDLPIDWALDDDSPRP